jgi:hypothetical protein
MIFIQRCARGKVRSLTANDPWNVGQLMPS